MGNIIVQKQINDQGNTSVGSLRNNTSILSKIINTALSSDESKKRACCLHLNKIPTVLPFVDSNNELSYGVIFITPLSLDYDFFNQDNSPNYIIDNVYGTYIKEANDTFIYDTSASVPKYRDQCMIAELSNLDIPTEESLIQFNNYVPEDWLYYDVGDHCRNFYEDIFCPQAITNKNCVLDNSPYIGKTDSSSGAFLYNNYTDCNCVNSTMITNNLIIPSSDFFYPQDTENLQYNDTAFVYLMDPRCTGNPGNTIRFIPETNVKVCWDAISLEYLHQTSGCAEIKQSAVCGTPGGPPPINICPAEGCPSISTSSNQPCPS